MREREEGKEPSAQHVFSPPPPLLPFIGKVEEEVLFMPVNGVCIYINTTKGYKWTLCGLYLQKYH
jgi:hypothetical protein